MDVGQVLRRIPKMDALLALPEISQACERFSYPEVKHLIGQELEGIRRQVLAGALDEVPAQEDIAARVLAGLEASGAFSLRPVINATGVVLHTNLGRAPFGERMARHVAQVAAGYSNLEYNLARGKRGSRYVHVEHLLCELTGAEAAMVVNNNAAAVFLMLNTLAAGEQVAVSRGELVEIGGSFRVPEIMAASGAELVEVGTTNKTHAYDYERAVEAGAQALLKVHTSNFVMRGFTEAVGIAELARIAHPAGARVLYDVGSALVFPGEVLGLTDVEVVRRAIADGADVVTFSGDKLLGSAQAGVIVGSQDAIQRMKRNQVTRMLRIDKLSLAALEQALIWQLDPACAREQVPALRMIAEDVETLEARAGELAGALGGIAGARLEVVPVVDEVGGGSLPGVELEGRAVALELTGQTAEELERALRCAAHAIVARVSEGRVLFSVRTLMAGDIQRIADTVGEIARDAAAAGAGEAR